MIDSERQVVPHVYAGDATYETQIDTEKDRFDSFEASLSIFTVIQGCTGSTGKEHIVE